MKIVRISPLNNGGKVKAFFDFQTNDGITIKSFRIVEGSKGLFISAPNEKGKDDKYYDSVILPKEMKDELEKLALQEYEKSKK